MESSYQQGLLIFPAVMRILMTSNYIWLPALGLTSIIFDSFEVHLVDFFFFSYSVLRLLPNVPQ